MNKKGMFMDLATAVMFVAVAAFLVLMVYLVLDGVNGAVQGNDAFPDHAQEYMAEQHDRIPKNFDFMIGFVFFGLFIVLIGLSWFLASNPIAFFIVFIVSIIAMGFAGFLSNAWMEISQTDAFSAAVTNFPITTFVMEYYLLLTVVLGFLMITVFFGKRQVGIE